MPMPPAFQGASSIMTAPKVVVTIWQNHTHHNSALTRLGQHVEEDFICKNVQFLLIFTLQALAWYDKLIKVLINVAFA